MASMRDIKQRIANVSSTEQIIKAMDMIASTKLHKARSQLNGVRPIYQQLSRIVKEISGKEEAKAHEFLKEREVKNSLYIILTSDQGFSGGYNANIISKTMEHMKQGKNEKILVVGSKGYDYFKNKNKKIIRKITDVADAQVYYETEKIAKWMTELYLTGKVDEVFIAYTQFENVLSYIPCVEKLLPLSTDPKDNSDRIERKYEPNVTTYIDYVIPLFLHMNIFRAFSESHTSEQAARMVSMDAAGKNASEMIEELTLMYNRRRQASITQELSEIVGSANILNKGGIHES